MLKRSKIDDDLDEPLPDDPGGAILVVNRDPDAAELVARLIEHAGLEATRFSDPGSVVDQLTEGGVAAVVVDVLGTGGQDTFAVLEGIRTSEASVRDTAVVILADSDADRLTAYRAGADGYLARPFHADDLISTINSTLGRSTEDRTKYRDVQLMGGATTS